VTVELSEASCRR